MQSLCLLTLRTLLRAALLVVSVPAAAEPATTAPWIGKDETGFRLERVILEGERQQPSDDLIGLTEMLDRAGSAREDEMAGPRRFTTLDEVLRTIEWRRGVASELDWLAP